MMPRIALHEGLGICPHCQKLQPAEPQQKTKCIRCHANFHLRKPKSIEFTLAWTIAAIVMFFPANLLPIMVFTTLGSEESSTILSGINTFIQMGMLPVAIIVFTASFIVPIGKIIGLLILTSSVKYGSKLTEKQQTKLYHLVEFLGPWSMLDVFVVAIMAAVVNLGFLTSIAAGDGITYFALMVLFTIFAAESFDPRLIWDSKNNDNK
ncbi:MAG: paraquat-inducible protein A [Thalassotalea sp.]